MTDKPFRVGIVGLKPETSWAALAHLPALRALPEDFEIAGVANSSPESGRAAAEACDIPRAFDNAATLVESADIDIVTITVKVPNHFDLVKAALEAGKHVYCEWPLGNGLAEARTLARLANEKGVRAVIGTQARVAPEMDYLRRLIDDGYVGDVLSTSLKGWGKAWGPTIAGADARGYLLDIDHGATMLTIPLGHTLAALRDVLGDISALSTVITNRRTQVRALDTDELLPMTAPDQILFSGVLSGGAPLSLHYIGGLPSEPVGFVWDIHGTTGDLRVTAPTGHTQMVPLSLSGAQGPDGTLEPIAVPDEFRHGWPQAVIPGNVARVYARMAADLRKGSHTAPTFDDAVSLHELLAAAEEAAENGKQTTINARNRVLPNLVSG